MNCSHKYSSLYLVSFDARHSAASPSSPRLLRPGQESECKYTKLVDRSQCPTWEGRTSLVWLARAQHILKSRSESCCRKPSFTWTPVGRTLTPQVSMLETVVDWIKHLFGQGRLESAEVKRRNKQMASFIELLKCCLVSSQKGSLIKRTYQQHESTLTLLVTELFHKYLSLYNTPTE